MENIKPNTFRENGIMNPCVSISQLQQFQHMVNLVSYIYPHLLSLSTLYLLWIISMQISGHVYISFNHSMSLKDSWGQD